MGECQVTDAIIDILFAQFMDEYDEGEFPEIEYDE